MVEDVGHNDGVDVAREVLHVDPVVKVGQVCLLASGLYLLTNRVGLLCLDHGCMEGCVGG